MPSRIDFLNTTQLSRINKNKNDNRQMQLYDPGSGAGSEYEYVSGLIEMPLAKSVSAAAEGEPVRVLRVHAPYYKRRVLFDLKKDKTPPVIPSPIGTKDQPLVSATIQVPYPSATLDGSDYSWRAMGSYTFVQAGQFSVASADGLPVCSMPVATAGQLDSPLLGTQSSQDNINPSTDSYWRYTNPTLYPATLMSHSLILGAVTSEELRI